MVLWETEFYAISVVTGTVERFRGMFVQAHSLQEAFLAAREMKLDYLQFTGEWFRDFDHVRMDETFYKQLLQDQVLKMDFDEFLDWLDLASTKKDLIVAREHFSDLDDFTEHVKIIDMKIKQYEEKKKDNNSEEGDSGSQVEES